MRWLIPGLFALATGCASARDSAQVPVVLAEGEGVVRVRCLIQEDGRLTNCRILSERPADQGFGEAALRAAGRARIAPDVLRARGAEVEYNVRFRLDQPAALDLQPPRA
ncbi:TonB family protein [Brevundimonas sp.]|uniref:TonB family protein n=1 Tax=Brevundimonas sp. TaxID=1871086 RepID=UPI00351D3369